jgi:UDPglucose 6-dehydrogenase
MLNIGIVGIGVVGSACKFGFELLGHSVSIHDIKLNTNIAEVLQTDIVYICVPTPSMDDGFCDTSIVQSVIRELKENNYSGIIAIKSTVEPGTTRKLKELYNIQKLCFVPEFLRERCSIADFTENHDVCIVGTGSDEIFEIVKECHGSFPKTFVKLTEDEAEFAKYFNNAYNATLIIFANSFFEACKIKNVNYTNVKNAVVKRNHINSNYLECNENFRGFGGVCLPKDTKALASLMKDTGIRFFDNLLEENKKYATTVFKGMRK